MFVTAFFMTMCTEVTSFSPSIGIAHRSIGLGRSQLSSSSRVEVRFNLDFRKSNVFHTVDVDWKVEFIRRVFLLSSVKILHMSITPQSLFTTEILNVNWPNWELLLTILTASGQSIHEIYALFCLHLRVLSITIVMLAFSATLTSCTSWRTVNCETIKHVILLLDESISIITMSASYLVLYMYSHQTWSIIYINHPQRNDDNEQARITKLYHIMFDITGIIS